MEKSELINIKFVEKGFNEINLSYPSYIYMVYNDEYTSCPLRVMNYLHIVSGENLVAPLKYYSDNIICEEGQKRMPNAIGPRIKNWIGANELARAQREDVERQEEDNPYPSDMQKYTGVVEHGKPTGIDQMYEVFFDIVNENKESTIIVRDPEIDLDQATMLVPDLISVTFSRNNENLIIFANFGSCEDTSILNDIWFVMQMKHMYQIWLGKHNGIKKVNLVIKVNNSDKKIEIPCFMDPNHKNYDCEGNDYWSQIRTLNQLSVHVQSFFGSDSVGNVNIDIKKLSDIIHRNFLCDKKSTFGDYEPIKIPLLRDMAKSLMIGGLVRNDKNGDPICQSLVKELLQEMVTPMKLEMQDYLRVNKYE